MNKILIISLLMLSGCAAYDPIIANTAVYEAPIFDMPERPTLVTIREGSYDEVSKNIELDMINLQQYCVAIEDILITIKSINNKEIYNLKE